MFLTQPGCHYIINWKNCWSEVTLVLRPCPKPCPAPAIPVGARWRSLPRVKPRGTQPGSGRLPTSDGHRHVCWGLPERGGGLWGPGQPRSTCASKNSLVFYSWDETWSLSNPAEVFPRDERGFLRACNKTNCWRQNNETGSMSSSSGSSEVNSLKIAIFHPPASHQNISKTDIKQPATNHAGT